MDILVSGSLLFLLSPVLFVITLLVWSYDFRSPFYVSDRVGKGGGNFRMIKFRSMTVGADRTGVTSTAGNDPRITPIGHLVRRFKLDELIQLYNVLVGDMSLVGPRPNVPSGVAVYTEEEKALLTVKPGMTDFASIVFSDEGEILRGQADPDTVYDCLIRPWKSRLGLFYIGHRTFGLDMTLVFLTAASLFSRRYALDRVAEVLSALGAPEELVQASRRAVPLEPTAAPGAG